MFAYHFEFLHAPLIHTKNKIGVKKNWDTHFTPQIVISSWAFKISVCAVRGEKWLVVSVQTPGSEDPQAALNNGYSFDQQIILLRLLL